MSFFKKLFSSKKKKEEVPQKIQSKKQAEEGQLEGVFTTDYFANRYTEDHIEENILDGCLKMIESYFIDAKVERKIEHPVHHPTNLDQVIDDGFGFHMYCKAFNLEDQQTTMFLAYAFSDYFIKNYGFTLYIDNEPEFPLRSMTLKYDKNGIVMSLYPIEYSLKVLNYEASFEDLYQKITQHIDQMPQKEELLNDFIKRATEGNSNDQK